jgi:hypothetical protein
MSAKLKSREMPSKYDADFKAALRVLKRAAKRARETAHRFKTPVVLWKDGRVKTVTPKTSAGKSR